VAFLDALKTDFAANQEIWKNNDLSSFLEAMAGWSRDMEGYYVALGEELARLPPWRVVADILMASRIYE
jgi:hypothetical protein